MKLCELIEILMEQALDAEVFAIKTFYDGNSEQHLPQEPTIISEEGFVTIVARNDHDTILHTCLETMTPAKAHKFATHNLHKTLITIGGQ